MYVYGETLQKNEVFLTQKAIGHDTNKYFDGIYTNKHHMYNMWCLLWHILY